MEPRRIKIHDYCGQQLEALGLPAVMQFELDNGDILDFEHPWLWDDAKQAAYDKVRSGGDLDRDENGEIVDPPRVGGKPAEPQSVRLARAILGPAVHKKFIAGGGKSNQIILAVEMMKRGDTTSTSEPDPKDRSS